MKVQSYNGGTILKITQNNTSYFWDVSSSSKIPENSSKLLNLIKDVLSVGCAKICDVGCAPYTLVSNSGACLVSNSGAFIVSNDA